MKFVLLEKDQSHIVFNYLKEAAQWLQSKNIDYW